MRGPSLASLAPTVVSTVMTKARLAADYHTYLYWGFFSTCVCFPILTVASPPTQLTDCCTLLTAAEAESAMHTNTRTFITIIPGPGLNTVIPTEFIDLLSV